MQTVFLIGTDHKFQCPTDGPNADGIAQFRSTIMDIFLQGKIAAIAEEMSLHALQERDLIESVAQQVSNLLGIRHQFSDPSPTDRYKLGIRTDNDIRAEHMLDEWAQEEVEADVFLRGAVPSDRIREQFWLRKILELDVWPLLFICGANHFTTFATLLRSNSIEVLEMHLDWEPTVI